MTTSRTTLWIAAAVVGLAAAGALAVKTNTWLLDEPAKLASGTFENISLTSRGELLLAPSEQRYELDDKQADTVNVLAIGPDKAVYAGTGPNGIVYRIADDKPQEFFKCPEGQIFSLLFHKDRSLLVGTGGQHGVIYKVDKKGKGKVFWQPENVRYIWSMARDAAGNIYAATGTDGEIYKITPDGKNAEKIASLNVKNILCLAFAGPKNLVFGTDSLGLVGSVDLASGRLRILYDAPEPNIAAITVDAEGSVYAATANVTREMAPGGAPPKPQGRPEPASASKPAKPDKNGRAAVLSASPGSAVGPGGNPVAKPKPGKQNAVYRIRPDGFVTEVLRLPVMFLAMVADGSGLLLGTSNPGRVYLLDPANEEYRSLVRADDSHFPAVLRTAKETYWIASAKPAAVVALGPRHAAQGTFTSEPLDAKQPARWGRVSVDLSIPRGTTATLQTRSSNVGDTEAPGWSAWSKPIDLAQTSEAQIPSAPARFLQYRLLFKADQEARRTPLVRSVRIPYIAENFPPEVLSLAVSTPRKDQKAKVRPVPPGVPAPKRAAPRSDIFTITWKARDPNDDRLTFNLYIRQAGRTRWIRIAEDLEKPKYAWDSKTVPDGRYEIRLVASDGPDNPPDTALARARISEPFIVDNSPPRIEALRWRAVRAGTYRVQARLVDAWTHIEVCEYALDSAEDFTAVLPTDDIFDSKRETIDFEIGPLEPGEHILTVKATDEYGNTAYAWLVLTVGG